MWLLFGSSLVIITIVASNNDAITFPEDENVEDRISGNGPEPTERIPLFVPGRCPTNMLLYPGDGNESTWICDCNYGYIYFPLNESCHAAYRQGPCQAGHYAVLPPKQVVPICERNPCSTDGLVPYNNTCSRLNAVDGPCGSSMTLGVNKTTFQLECLSPNVGGLNIIDPPSNRCPNGSKRNGLNQCRKVL